MVSHRYLMMKLDALKFSVFLYIFLFTCMLRFFKGHASHTPLLYFSFSFKMGQSDVMVFVGYVW